ncbi:Fe-S cluster assembly protein SufD [Levilactobacillus acidifarinae]|uniref:ABC transporter component n=1 Tax=Levilactobacillus acidifarinae DSM 19394 = JCM 15949 TaxID=1423715 RepID=A0A0R1LSU3_9LACO|nr:Fe-S cluster assembly protein SufD [Levilactobacillus acidifarinae]KRK95218.1 ABC transporter component [Levilactobacillus acidifarinae DSM 19394]GEO70662.1 Fe-S cluster assembly protein SufD [Levilactobacillus acidifarinae]
MNAVESTETLNAALVASATEHRDPDWLVAQRTAALAQIEQLRVPKFHRFTYRDWNLLDHRLLWQASDPTLAAGITQASDHGQIIQVGQTTVAVNLPQALRDQGVILTDLFTALTQYPELTKPYLNQIIPATEDKLAAYHVAYLNGGLFLYVPQNVVVDDPIEAHIVQDSTQDGPQVSHVLIVADQGSQVAFTQHLTTQGTRANLVNNVVEIVANDNSRVKFASVDELGRDTLTYFNRRALVKHNAEVDWAVGLMNLGDTLGQFDTNLVGEGAQTETKVVAITSQDQREGINTRITNRGKHTVGNILQRGVLLGTSELVFNGIGDIIHGASGANAEQENRLLMMTPGTHGDANPILLIDENDVIAGHAASVGQVDQSQLYYLMSRGIDRKTAERLVIRGFLSTVLSAIPSKNVQQQLIKTIERNLQNG